MIIWRQCLLGQYNFTYELPENFQQSFVHFLSKNGRNDLAQDLLKCKIVYSDMGYAYYAGMKGDVWNKMALDFTIECGESVSQSLKNNGRTIKNWLEKFISPSISGYLVRRIDFIIRDNEIEVTLPEHNGDDFETLNRDITDSLARNEPVLVLDRLHTYSIKYIRGICQKHNIPVSADNGDPYPLQSLAGSLVKFYQQNNYLDSEFAERALKSSISLFDSYNAIRNNQSFAHDNKVLNKEEATYAVEIVSATLKFIDKIEKS